MKLTTNAFFIAAFTLTMVSSCGRREANKQTNDIGKVTETTAQTVAPGAAVFTIKGEEIPIRSSPDKQSPKIINEKATSIIGETQYCHVDYSTKVEILEAKGDWSKIRVVDPEWLKDTYIGWIPTKYIINPADVKQLSAVKLAPENYEILATRHNNAMENFHVLFKPPKFNKEDLYLFTQQFRKEHCTRNCNVSLYDSKSIKKLIGVYPLPDRDYLQLADHLLSISTFDAPELKDWYPYQDVKYNELGGKNKKKEF